MPLLFSLGIHDALHGLGSEHLMAFHDDVHVVTLPHHVAHSFSVVQEPLRRAFKHASSGRSKCGMPVVLSQVLVRSSSGLLTPRETERQCGRLLDCPQSYRASKFWEHLRLRCSSLGSSFEPHSSGAHPSGAERPVCVGSAPSQCSQPGQSQSRQTGTHGGFCHRARRRVVAMHVRFSGCLWTRVLPRDTASLPLALGGLGLRNAVQSKQSANWASWADTRHRAIAESFVEALVTGVGPWPALVAGARPPPPPLDDPGGWRTGQHEAASRVVRHFRDTSLMPRLNDTRGWGIVKLMDEWDHPRDEIARTNAIH